MHKHFAVMGWIWIWALMGCSDSDNQGCASAFDCNDGQICSAEVCVTPPPCAVDTDCAAGICEMEQCLNRVCFVDAECGPRRVCTQGACNAPPPERCFEDADCDSGNCDAQSGTCGDPPAVCMRDAMCAADERCITGLCQDAAPCALDTECDAADACLNGICRSGCRVEPDSCPPEQWCEPESRLCATGCAIDAHCPEAEYCSPAGCARGCRDGACSDGGTCDLDTRTCGCDSDATCPDGTYCGDEGCVPGCRDADPTCVIGTLCDLESRTCRCSADSCPDGLACDPVDGVCVDVSACVQDVECPDDAWCGPDGCVPGCRVDACGADRRCDLETRQCACATDAGCADAEFCDAGQCRDGCRLDGCPGGACNLETRQCDCADDEGCPAGQFCALDAAEQSCVPGCRLAPDDCAQGLCDAETRQCNAAVCATDADCAAEQACVVVLIDDLPALRCAGAFADGRAEDVCANDADCASRLCLNIGLCFSGCVRDLDCPSLSCETVTLIVGEDVQVDLQSCIPPPADCAADVDCPDGQGCVPIAGDAPLVPRFICQPLGDLGAGGAACEDGAQCASAACVVGRCFSPCTPGAEHCVMGERCYPNQLYYVDDRGNETPADDQFRGFATCLPDQGSDQVCADGRCPAGEACTVRTNRDNDGLDRVCATAIGAGIGGNACRDDAACASGACITGGLCLGICDPDNPAGQCAPGTGCGEVGFVLNDRGTENPFDDLVAEVPACVP